MRNDNTLTQLTDEQRDQLFAWLNDLTYAEVEKRAAEPPPAGFGLKIHRTTLRRFFHERLRSECETILDATEPTPACLAAPNRLFAASQTAVAYSTFHLAHSSASPQLLNQLSRALHRHESLNLKRAFIRIAERHAALAEARVEIERQRLKLKETDFCFNAARVAAKHAHEIKEVIKMKGPDAEEKIWMVSDIVFGPSPDRAKYQSQIPPTNQDKTPPQQ